MGDILFASAEKWQKLRQTMERLGLSENDILETFIRGSGKGGQKINKTSSCVDILHKPTGLRIKCQKTRYRELNRFLARRELCTRMEELIAGVKSQREAEIAKERRRKARRSRRAKLRLRKLKEERSIKKTMRQRVDLSEIN